MRFYHVCNLIITVNSASNFVVYCLFRRQFQRQLRQLVSGMVCCHDVVSSVSSRPHLGLVCYPLHASSLCPRSRLCLSSVSSASARVWNVLLSYVLDIHRSRLGLISVSSVSTPRIIFVSSVSSSVLSSVSVLSRSHLGLTSVASVILSTRHRCVLVLVSVSVRSLLHHLVSGTSCCHDVVSSVSSSVSVLFRSHLGLTSVSTVIVSTRHRCVLGLVSASARSHLHHLVSGRACCRSRDTMTSPGNNRLRDRSSTSFMTSRCRHVSTISSPVSQRISC